MEKSAPRPTDQYEVRQQFISSGLRRVDFDTHGLGLLFHFQSLQKPAEALQLVLAAPDAERLLHALRSFADQIEQALQNGPPDGPLQ